MGKAPLSVRQKEQASSVWADGCRGAAYQSFRYVRPGRRYTVSGPTSCAAYEMCGVTRCWYLVGSSARMRSVRVPPWPRAWPVCRDGMRYGPQALSTSQQTRRTRSEWNVFSKSASHPVHR